MRVGENAKRWVTFNLQRSASARPSKSSIRTRGANKEPAKAIAARSPGSSLAGNHVRGFGSAEFGGYGVWNDHSLEKRLEYLSDTYEDQIVEWAGVHYDYHALGATGSKFARSCSKSSAV